MAEHKCVSETFAPGWFWRTLHEAHIRCMVDNNPAFFRSEPKRPVPPSEAFEIFKLMDSRFEAWTGMPLAEYLDTKKT